MAPFQHDRSSQARTNHGPQPITDPSLRSFPRNQFVEATAASSAGDRTTTVSVSRAEYRALSQVAHKYANLCQNLINGGVGEDTIELLSSHVSPGPASQGAENASATNVLAPQHPSVAGPSAASSQNAAPLFAQTPAQSAVSNSSRCPGHHGGSNNAQATWEDASELSEEDPESSSDLATDATRAAEVGEIWNAPTQPRFEREATRSIHLFNLADGTSHADITSVVRGGLLLDVYLKYRDNSAVISFLHGVDAQAFYEHVRQNGLYIKNQRVDIRWNKCQFTLAGHTAHKIGLGATRNLVIRHHNPNLTERQIRDDLEHIHNLAVIKVEFLGNCCHISTNSVHNAVFARLCMMSRREYKGSRIEWGIDECAQPLDRMALPNRRRSMAPTAANKGSNAPMNQTMNRFELLKLDD